MPTRLPDHLTRLSPWRHLAALALDWALILACIVGAILFPGLVTYLAAAILIARTQLALAVLMHESAHGVAANGRRLNDFLGQFLAAGPLLLSMFVYRQGHMKHHRAPIAPDDPVAMVFGIGDYPVPRRQLAWRLLKDVTGIGYVLTLRDVLSGKHRLASAGAAQTPSAGETVLVLASIVLTNGALLGGLAAAGHWKLYLGLWILPAVTLLPLFARIRAIAEHAGYPPGDDQTRNARSIRPGWQTFFCGPHGIHFHIEHHQHVRVPFYHLRELHSLMMAQGMLPAENLYRGYGQVLKDVTHP